MIAVVFLGPGPMLGTEWLSVRFCLDRWIDGRVGAWVGGCGLMEGEWMDEWTEV